MSLSDLEAVHQALADIETVSSSRHGEDFLDAMYDIRMTAGSGLAAATRLLDAARAEGRPSPEGEEAHAQAVEPFLRLAREVIHPANGDRPWHADSKDWMVVFSFAGQSITLGDLRRAAFLSPSSPEPEDLEDAISDALQDSLGPDWTCRDGAKAVMRLLKGRRS